MKFSIIAVLASCLAVASGQVVRSVDESSEVHRVLEESRTAQRSKPKKTPENMDMTAIKQHHERRMAKLEEMIEQRRVMIEEHESGRRRLSDEEYSQKANQHKIFQRKLETMRAKTDVSYTTLIDLSRGFLVVGLDERCSIDDAFFDLLRTSRH